MAARLTWISWDECAIEPKDRRVRVDEDWFLFARTRVEECEEWCKQGVAKIIALVIG